MKAAVILTLAGYAMASVMQRGAAQKGDNQKDNQGKSHVVSKPVHERPNICNLQVLGSVKDAVAAETRTADCSEFLRTTVTGAPR